MICAYDEVFFDEVWAGLVDEDGIEGFFEEFFFGIGEGMCVVEGVVLDRVGYFFKGFKDEGVGVCDGGEGWVYEE